MACGSCKTRPYIFTELGHKGRLGNQYFQIASTIGIALKNGKTFGFNTWRYKDWYTSKLPVVLGYKELYDEGSNLDYREISGYGKRLTGYFQSERYFENCKGYIVNIFNQTEWRQNYTKDKYKQYTQAIHIRLTDYIELNWFAGWEWYDKLIEQYDKTKPVLILTDDRQMVSDKYKQHFDSGWFIHIDHEDEGVCIETMSLMQRLNVPNSSFSWWGAWLGEQKGNTKEIYYPKTHPGGDFPNKDYYPNRTTWKQL